MEKKTKEKGRPIWVLLILVLFAKNVLKFFSEGGDKIDIVWILFKLTIILAALLFLLNKEKIIENKEEFMKQTKLDKYLILKK